MVKNEDTKKRGFKEENNPKVSQIARIKAAYHLFL